MADFGQCRADFFQRWSMSTNVGRIRPTLSRTPRTLLDFGRADFGHTCQNSRTVSRCVRFRTHLADLGAVFDSSRVVLDQIWADADRTWAGLGNLSRCRQHFGWAGFGSSSTKFGFCLTRLWAVFGQRVGPVLGHVRSTARKVQRVGNVSRSTPCYCAPLRSSPR